MKKKKAQKLVVYTVLVGEKEGLNNPLQYVGNRGVTDLDIEYVCFTDNDELTSPIWQFRKLEHPLLPAEKLSRLPKTMPHRFFQDAGYSLYIDNTVVFKRLPAQNDITGAMFRGFRHPWRSSPQDEADIVAQSGLDSPEIVAAQVNFYAARTPLDRVGHLTTGTVLLRQHNHPAVQKFGELWWEQILLFSKRDQISLDLCAQQAACDIDYFIGDKTSNDLFLWPVLADGRRVQGGFDADRYAWEHRSDPLAVQSPRTHFLANSEDGAAYDKRVSKFRYACERQKSSLGYQVPPRRGMADVVDGMLTNLRNKSGKILIVGIGSSAAYAAEADELVAAKAAIEHYFRFEAAHEVVLAMVGAQEMDEAAAFQAAQGQAGFALVLVLGLPAKHYPNAMSKFLPLLEGGASLLLEFGESLSIEAILAMRETVSRPCRVDVFHGQHISSEKPTPSSVFVLNLLGA